MKRGGHFRFWVTSQVQLEPKRPEFTQAVLKTPLPRRPHKAVRRRLNIFLKAHMTQFSDLGLAAPLLKALEMLGHTEPTPIQAQAIPALLEGHDLLGIAQTGTGKTGAFALPVLHTLNATQKEGQRLAKSTRALVLAPTRELANQIAESFRDYGQLLGLKTVVVVGGVPIPKQIRNLERGTDVLIATPGRLEDLMKQRAITLQHVTHLILDEADQMLDLGFIHVLKRIASVLPRDRQTLLFSATMPKTIADLAAQFLTNPKKVAVAQESTTAELVNQTAYFPKAKDKPSLMARLLKDRAVTRAIIFTRTKHGANRLVKQLDAANLDSLAIHGNKTQAQRQKALNAFRDGQCNILVATDVAARGIDIPLVSHVFNYELPDVPEQYVHRIGRTARAGNSGEAVALVCDGERTKLRDIERLTKIRLSIQKLPEGFQEELEGVVIPHEPDFEDSRSHRGRGGPRQGSRSAPRQSGANGGGQSRAPRGEGRGRDFSDRGDRPARAERPARDFGDRGDRPARAERPARDFGDRPQRPSRPAFNPDRDFGDSREGLQRAMGDRPARSNDGAKRSDAPRRKPDGERRFEGRNAGAQGAKSGQPPRGKPGFKPGGKPRTGSSGPGRPNSSSRSRENV